MYHRVADSPVDYWSLAVSPARFEEQLLVLRRSRHPLPLKTFVSNHIAGTLPPDAVALTFDDGYVDNLLTAKPRLAAANVPATVFLATGYLDRAEEFWWDELTRLILLEIGPQSIELVIRGKSMHIDLGTESFAHEDGTIRSASRARREAALMPIWRVMRSLDDHERESIMGKLRSVFTPGGRQTGLGRAMTRKEVRALVTDGLVTIGAHTVTHPALSELGPAACHQEITESKLTCEALTGAPAAGFSYPYGDFSANARRAVMSAGFAFACSSRHGPTTKACDLFALPRINVHNWNGDAFEQALRSASELT